MSRAQGVASMQQVLNKSLLFHHKPLDIYPHFTGPSPSQQIAAFLCLLPHARAISLPYNPRDELFSDGSRAVEKLACTFWKLS